MTTVAKAKTRLIPLKTIFGNPEKAGPKISPAGDRLAFLAPYEGVLNLWLCDSLDPGAKPRPITKDRGRGIRAYLWGGDGSLIYLQDKDGDENWHLYRVHPDAGAVRDLTPFAGSQAQPLATEPKFPDELLAAINVRDKRLHDVYRVNLKTGAAALEVENPGDVIGWLADRELRVRAAKAQLPDGSSELRYRDADNSPWRTLVTWGPDENGGAHGFTPDNKRLTVESSLGADTTRLIELDPAGGKETEIFRHAEADIGPVIFHPSTNALQAVGYDLDRLHWEVRDESIAGDFAALREVTDGDFRLVSRDDADRFWVLLYDSDTRPPRHYLYSRETKTARFLFSTRPQLEHFTFGATEPVAFKARDGLKLHGYLTLPPGKKPSRLPLVLLVHGGPWARDHYGFSPECLWLSNRGYAVLRVNFRGSIGYGKKFLHAGDREWGAKMQDDLTDSVRWAVEKGAADPKRIAIFGGSYGGYAALAGAAFTPRLYACAVDIVGPSNLVTLIRSIPPYWEPLRRVFDLRVGNVDTELEFLKERSPLYSADRIEIPLLIAQGANDPRVKAAESEMIVEALRKKGKRVEYMLFPDEGHGFARPENRLKFFRAAEGFLEKNLRA